MSITSGAGTLPSHVDGLLCFCHLRWSFVWQRPQHILSRLSSATEVVVVEEPEFDAATTAPTIRQNRAGRVTLLTPVLPDTPGHPWGFSDDCNADIARLVERHLVASGWSAPGRRNALWLYTPMALHAVPSGVPFDVTVYDVMDDLASFKNAPAELSLREQALMRRADVVFTGGPSLYRSRADRHRDVSCYPSGVDAAHFASAGAAARPADVAGLTGPIIGFYGVIDERLDIELLRDVAAARPDWTFVVIGPVVKIDPASLPAAANIHYLGMRTYDELPSYLGCFDVAILPFALNEATRFISPTKTLEYMAGGVPIVSTPITDVADLYGDTVAIADRPSTFVAAIETALAESPTQRVARRRRYLEHLARHDWDTIVSGMWSSIGAALPSRYIPSISAATMVATPAD